MAVLMAGVGTAEAASNGGSGGPLPQPIRSIMDKAQYANANWGLLESDAQGRTILSNRANEMFIPGSSAKLFSVSAVWKTLGPDHRFTTPVYAIGTRNGPTLDGDLVLVGSGDLSLGGRTTPEGGIAWTNYDHADANAIPGATLTPEDPLAGIENLAAQVRASGLTSVSDVVIDDRMFSADFEPQPTPVMINDNLIDLVATPTTPGQPATFTYRPAAATLTVDPTVTTVAAGQPSKLTITGEAPGMIKVTGQVAAGSQPLVNVAPISDPSSFARTVFIQALEKAGVQVAALPSGTNPTAELPASQTYPPDTKVAAYVSPPYKDYANLILKVSHNLGANLGVCLLAVQAGSGDCNDGFPVIQSFLKKAGVPVDQLVLNDGRGGDPADRATPTAVVDMLRYWMTQPDFAQFRACLPILGTDGSLTDVATSSPAKGKVFAKTGTLIAQDVINGRLAVQAKALAGYFQTKRGSWRVFDIVVNNAGGDLTIQPVLDANEDVGQIAAQLWALGR
jgi:D-alanyl-D-alanine carboxypeptidase/D-alanyl-D-alanine-endopeptidase (penicillin-binding protein 4)